MKATTSPHASLLLLSTNEIEILDLLHVHMYMTPASLAKLCTIPRPTIYLTLEKLAKRGIVHTKKIGRKKVWEAIDASIILDKIDSLKKVFVSETDTYQKIAASSSTDIAIHRGEEAIANLLIRLIEKHSGNRLVGIQGDFAGDAWKDTFALERINAINNKIKKEKMLTEIITSKEWFDRQMKTFGVSWAENFLGRAAQIHFINNTYLNYESQIFIFEDQLFLISMREEIFIEVKNKQISKLIISLLKFMEDHSPTVDVNKLLKEMLDNKK